MNRRLLKVTVLLVVMLLFAAACGDDDKDSAGDTTATTKASTDTTEASGSKSGAPAGETLDWDALQTQAEKVEGTIDDVTGNTTRGITKDTIRISGVTTLKDPTGI